jgi:hypothetical protein
MKEFFKVEQELGAEGKVSAALGAEDQHFKVELSASYPIAKVVEPATKALDGALDKLEQLIPGDWDKAIIADVKREYKEKLVELLTQ